MTSEADSAPIAGDSCITCGDVAVPLEVVTVHADVACCRDDDEHFEDVAIDLVGAVYPGDRLLVHAGVALLKLPDASARRFGRAPQ